MPARTLVLKRWTWGNPRRSDAVRKQLALDPIVPFVDLTGGRFPSSLLSYRGATHAPQKRLQNLEQPVGEKTDCGETEQIRPVRLLPKCLQRSRHPGGFTGVEVP